MTGGGGGGSATQRVYVERVTRKSTNIGTDVKLVVPVSRLDTPAVDGVFGMFYDSYEDQFYYWQTIEISRRVLQTSMVTVVKMVFPGFQLPYAVMVSTLSIASHAYFQPYKDQHKDRLQFWVLFSSWVCLFTLFVKKFNGWNGWSFLGILFSSQVIIMGIGLNALWYAESKRVKGQVKRLMTKAETLKKNVALHSFTSKKISKGDGKS